jgi:hypothetical protein
MKASRIALAATVAAFAYAGCECGDPLTRLDPKIEIGDPYDAAFSVCRTDFVKDCAYSFGDVGIGQPKVFSFTIKNPSRSDLNVKSVAFSDGSSPAFTFTGDLPERISKGADKIVSVKFAPEVEAPATATVLIESDAVNVEGPIEIRLDANGVDLGRPDIVVVPEQCDFGAVGIGQTAFCELTIKNEGQNPLVLASFGWAPGTPSIFEDRTQLAADTVVNVGTGVTVRLAATPQTVGLITGGLVINSNDPGKPQVTVPLTVNGANTPTAVARVKSINGTPNSEASPAVEPLDNVELSGDQSTPGTPGATIASYQWTIIEKPPESSVQLTAPTQRETRFVFSSATGNVNGVDVAGTFVIGLVVTDSTGAVSANTATVTLNVVPTQGLHVQLTWSSQYNDIDLHLGRTASPQWCSQQDCYYGNCTWSPPDWDGVSGFSAGDPKLDIDDLTGFGPENINIDNPVNGVYVIGIHAFSGNGTPGGGFTPTDLTVKVFLGGALAAELFGHFDRNRDFWTAARVDIVNGVGSVTPIDTYQQSWSCF